MKKKLVISIFYILIINFLVVGCLISETSATSDPGEIDCVDGIDNDFDGAVDEADMDCDFSENCPKCESGDQCTDSEDNDGDGNSDCADGGCADAIGPNGETCEPLEEFTCDDGADNDGDGDIDCADEDCLLAISNCSSGGSGCSVTIADNTSILNFLMPIIGVGLLVSIRRKNIDYL